MSEAGGTQLSTAKLEKPPFKKTDFRYQKWVTSRKALRDKAKRSSFKIEYRRQIVRPDAVTIDTSKAKGSLDVVRLCVKSLRWREFPLGRRDGKSCDIYWHACNFDDGDVPGGVVNKFPGMGNMCHKVTLGRALDLMHHLFPHDYNFHPRQWFLPQQYAEFMDSCRRLNTSPDKGKPFKSKSVFIVKPDDGSQGDGIYLINDATDYRYVGSKNHIVQEYIAQPFLLEGLKFDLRVYVLLTCIDPLEIYIAREGLARFCTQTYEYPEDSNLHEVFMHLTNYSLNKISTNYVHSDKSEQGSKRMMTAVFKQIEKKGYAAERIWEQIKDLVIKTIIAILPQLKVQMHAACSRELQRAAPSCFQILGFDILLDHQCKPYLLEVNSNPSLRIDYEKAVAPGIFEHVFSEKDADIKKPVVKKALKIVVAKYFKRPAVTCQSSIAQSKSSKKNNSDKENSMADDHNSGNEDSDDNTEDDANNDDDEEKEQGNSNNKSSDNYTESTKDKDEVYEKIYPASDFLDYEEFRILERTSFIFLESLGVRGQLAMGTSAFRNFTRRCKIAGLKTTLSNAALDIMFIELLKRWEYMCQENTSTLCYQGFIEAFLSLAKRLYPSVPTLLKSVQAFLDHCENSSKQERAQLQRKAPRLSHIPRLPLDRMDGAFTLPPLQISRTEGAEAKHKPFGENQRIQSLKSFRNEKRVPKVQRGYSDLSTGDNANEHGE